MTFRTVVPSEDAPMDEGDRYARPVCGIELTLSSFLTPERDYYCPFCATRQTPSVL
jgi:hypothetical protein